MVAELFAEWTSWPEDKNGLNQLTWEASLWLLPDTVKALGQWLINAPGARDLKVGADSRTKTLWAPSDDVTEGNIIHI
jgi:hypothetical protein